MSNPNKFVFRKERSGKLDFVGDFEGLYRAEADPWGQAACYNNPMSQYYRFSRSQLIGAIQRRVNSVSRLQYQLGMEIGCGHGYVVDTLMHLTRLTWVGMDISELAIVRAKQLFPKYYFYVGDVTKHIETDIPSGGFDVVILGQMFWYIMHDMDVVMENCYRLINPGGLLILSQAFLTKPQEYGKEIANGFVGALKLLMRYEKFTLLEARYEDQLKLPHNDGIFILRKE